MKELIASIEEYIRKPYTDYAIMINGEWGSGKTHFWNNKLRQRIEIIKNKADKTYKTIYISLYGINSIEEISKKIFLETNPVITKTLKKFAENVEGNVIPEYVKTGLDIANLYGTMQMDGGKIDFAKMFATDDKVLCFDDLERANIDIIDILGYINNFVEHDGIKTILICNEKELATKFKNSNIEIKTLIATLMLEKESKDNKTKIVDTIEEPIANKLEEKVESIFDRANAYERIKEKLVGECFEYVPEYSYILSGMIMRYDYNLEYERFLKKEMGTIINIFNKTNTKNLRVLKHALNDLERIYSNVTTEYPEASNELLKTILIFTIAIAFEIKVGNVVKAKFNSINSNDEYKSILFTSNIINGSSQYYLREFDTRYFLNSKEDYRFFKFIEVYIRTRMFDEKLFKEDMEKAMQKVEKKGDPVYQKILDGSYWKMADIDFEITAIRVLEDIKEGNIPSYEYTKLFAIYKELCDLKLIDAMTPEDLSMRFLLGFKIALTKEKEQVMYYEEKYDGLDSTDDIIRIFAEECRAIRLQYTEDLEKEAVHELFRTLVDDVDMFYKNIVGKYKNVSVFEKYEMDLLYDKLSQISNYDLHNFLSIIETRYMENKDLLKFDKKNLKKLSKVIETKGKNLPVTIKTALLNKLKDNIDVLCGVDKTKVNVIKEKTSPVKAKKKITITNKKTKEKEAVKKTETKKKNA